MRIKVLSSTLIGWHIPTVVLPMLLLSRLSGRAAQRRPGFAGVSAR
jgi:hypothetical protein